MGRIIFAALLGAFGGWVIGFHVASATWSGGPQGWYMARIAMAVYPVVGALFGALSVWLARWERNRRK
ncbi:MAG: hypothetical protein JNL18_17875 [Planctomycetaceae bacterium]|nr:hypothetical protein [Planctomycetaceae bacterium]